MTVGQVVTVGTCSQYCWSYMGPRAIISRSCIISNVLLMCLHNEQHSSGGHIHHAGACWELTGLKQSSQVSMIQFRTLHSCEHVWPWSPGRQNGQDWNTGETTFAALYHHHLRRLGWTKESTWSKLFFFLLGGLYRWGMRAIAPAKQCDTMQILNNCHPPQNNFKHSFIAGFNLFTQLTYFCVISVLSQKLSGLTCLIPWPLSLTSRLSNFWCISTFNSSNFWKCIKIMPLLRHMPKLPFKKEQHNYSKGFDLILCW